MGTRARQKKPMVDAVKPIKGIEVKYRKKMESLIDEMNDSLERFIVAEYRKQGLANDENPAKAMARRLKKLTNQWIKRFSDFAVFQSSWFTNAVDKQVTGNTKRAFEKAIFQANTQNMTVKFRQTDEVKSVLASIEETQINLIKSIPEQHLKNVSTLVQNAVVRGYDVYDLKQQLRHQTGVSKRRAKMIARDQNAKAAESIQNARAASIGVTRAYWRHQVSGQKTFRQDHVNADGWKFNIKKGCLINGVRIMPAEEPNCRCIKQFILPNSPDDNDDNLH